jgi:hypothetical protein
MFLAGCGDSQLTAWGLTGQRTDVTTRIGVRQGDAELFGTVKYNRSSGADWDDPDIAGGGVIFHLTQDGTITDTPDPSPIGPLLEALHVRPYAGIEVVGDTDARTRDFQENYIFGTAFTVGPDGNIALTVEYIDGSQTSSDVNVGMMGRF